jgi:hypothetical protein
LSEALVEEVPFNFYPHGLYFCRIRDSVRYQQRNTGSVRNNKQILSERPSAIAWDCLKRRSQKSIIQKTFNL